MLRTSKLPACGAMLAAALTLGAGAASANMRYQNPVVNGAIVDWCSTWATNCGSGGARQFCQMRGHPGAVSWNTYHPGRTWVIGSSTFCNGPICQGFSQVTCAAASAPGPVPGPVPGGAVQRFHHPRLNGAIVDWCSTWATNCGWGGAHQLCQNYGFARAMSWNIYRPGRTWVIGSNQFCDGPICQGFSQVTCRRY